MTATLAARSTSGRSPCGFCATGHHGFCPRTIRNGSAAKSPVWSCVCAEEDHTLGGAHREAKVERLPPRPIMTPRDLGQPAVGAPVGAVARPRPAVTAAKAQGSPFPAGVIAPVAFRHLLVAEGLAPESMKRQQVYQWIKQAEQGKGGFPVAWFAADGTRFDAPQDGARPGVLLDQARDWFKTR